MEVNNQFWSSVASGWAFSNPSDKLKSIRFRVEGIVALTNNQLEEFRTLTTIRTAIEEILDYNDDDDDEFF